VDALGAAVVVGERVTKKEVPRTVMTGASGAHISRDLGEFRASRSVSLEGIVDAGGVSICTSPNVCSRNRVLGVLGSLLAMRVLVLVSQRALNILTHS
jgi:hypothetical protein